MTDSASLANAAAEVQRRSGGATMLVNSAGFTRPVPAADLVQGTTLPAGRFMRRNADFQPDAGAFNNLASFGEDAQRNLYIVDFDGEIFQIRAGA